MITEKGTLARWFDDRGFGFIKPENGKRDIFIHISAFKNRSRHPVVGDVIYYQVSVDNDGKTRAINAKIDGVSEDIANPAAWSLTPLDNNSPSKHTAPENKT